MIHAAPPNQADPHSLNYVNLPSTAVSQTATLESAWN